MDTFGPEPPVDPIDPADPNDCGCDCGCDCDCDCDCHDSDIDTAQVIGELKDTKIREIAQRMSNDPMTIVEVRNDAKVERLGPDNGVVVIEAWIYLGLDDFWRE